MTAMPSGIASNMKSPTTSPTFSNGTMLVFDGAPDPGTRYGLELVLKPGSAAVTAGAASVAIRPAAASERRAERDDDRLTGLLR